jgi:glycosyltransferase involved in cell wall biosynthesis
MEAARERSLGLKEELGLAGKRILLFVGALTEGKRLEDLGQVYARLKQSRPDLCLLIVGDGAYRSTLESHFANAGTPDVLFTGQVIDDVSAYFLIGDIFVLPGLGGLAVSEALVHGLPVVSAEADGCEVDLVEEGKNGYRIETGDLETLHDRIAELLDDEAKRSSMAARSKWIVKNRFNINSYMENLIAALDYAVESSRSKRA